MSLLDAMLLDPYRDPREVWIALRTDGQRGSGTVDDPYNGSAHPSKVLQVTLSIPDPTNKPAEALATTASSHGFADDDVVRITGATGASADLWNGDFVVFEANTTSFKCQMRRPPEAPAGGDPVALQLVFGFDEAMADVPEGALVRLGPGVFETRGNSDGDVRGWAPKKGQKIKGAGMAVTTLRLVQARFTGQLYRAIGAGYNAMVTHFEASDFTVDCNLSGQPVTPRAPWAALACGAIAVPGSHTRIRRIRAINFGTQTPGAECFVLSSAGAHPDQPEQGVDCLIEDCIVEEPSRNNARETTCIIMSAGARLADGVTAYHRACVIRNCFVNSEYATDPVAIDSIVQEANQIAMATMRGPHGRKPDDWIVVSGAVENGKQSRHFNGSFKVTSIDAENRRLLWFNYYGANPAPATGTMFLDRYSSHEVRVLHSSTQGNEVTLQSITPHNRKPGDTILLWGNDAGVGGPFVVAEVPDPYRFTFETTNAPPSGDAMSIGPLFQAISADAGTAAVVAGNRVIHCRTGGPYHDTYSTRDLLTRDNFHHDVFGGPAQALAGLSGLQPGGQPPAVPIDLNSFAVSTVGGKWIVTVHVSSPGVPHDVIHGDVVRIVSPPGYSGNFQVVKVIDDQTFQYGYLDSDPGPSPAAGSFWRVWQTRRQIVEANWFELAYDPDPYGIRSLRAIATTGESVFPAHRFHQVLIRDNWVRIIDEPSYPGVVPNHAANLVDGAQKVTAENNVVDLPDRDPPPQLQRIRFYQTGQARPAGNWNPAGEPVLAYAYLNPTPPNQPAIPDTDTDAVETAFLSAFL
jgi:hypothetical protein